MMMMMTTTTKPPTSQEAMEMASKLLLYAQESADVSDKERDSYLQLVMKLHAIHCH